MPAFGAFRMVFRPGQIAIKVPRLKNFAAGMRCNRWEREMWTTWRPVFGWENLCPILAADPLGFFVIMRLAQQPVTEAEALDAFRIDYWPDVEAESKQENFGRVGDRVVVLDYGIDDAAGVQHRRKYLQTHPARRK